MAQVWLGGGLFVIETALTGMTFQDNSPAQMACAVAIGMVGALPTACKLASCVFGSDTDVTASQSAGTTRQA